MTIAEISVIIGLSITKTLNMLREIEYRIDCIAVILKECFFELLNIEKTKNPLTKYRIMLIDVISIIIITKFHLILYILIIL